MLDSCYCERGAAECGNLKEIINNHLKGLLLEIQPCESAERRSRSAPIDTKAKAKRQGVPTNRRCGLQK
jgi:hypothetical protein